jgi:hypothetical protein
MSKKELNPNNQKINPPLLLTPNDEPFKLIDEINNLIVKATSIPEKLLYNPYKE